jgi:hypothetical protein
MAVSIGSFDLFSCLFDSWRCRNSIELRLEMGIRSHVLRLINPCRRLLPRPHLPDSSGSVRRIWSCARCVFRRIPLAPFNCRFLFGGIANYSSQCKLQSTAISVSYRSTFSLCYRSHKLVMIGAGVGIAPFRAFLQHIPKG